MTIRAGVRAVVLASALAALAPSGVAAAEHVITMAGSRYSPSTIVARIGDTIRFVNDDHAQHNVFVPTVGFGVDLGAQKGGETRMLPLRKSGSFEVECVMHPEMAMKVTVGR